MQFNKILVLFDQDADSKEFHLFEKFYPTLDVSSPNKLLFASIFPIKEHPVDLIILYSGNKTSFREENRHIANSAVSYIEKFNKDCILLVAAWNAREFLKNLLRLSYKDLNINIFYGTKTFKEEMLRREVEASTGKEVN